MTRRIRKRRSGALDTRLEGYAQAAGSVLQVVKRGGARTLVPMTTVPFFAYPFGRFLLTAVPALAWGTAVAFLHAGVRAHHPRARPAAAPDRSTGPRGAPGAHS